ncbi:hypothetical protein CaCOL14_008682 [Colletotrichum acutatum]
MGCFGMVSFDGILLVNKPGRISRRQTFMFTLFGPTAGNQSYLFSVRAVVPNIVGKRASTGFSVALLP